MQSLGRIRLTEEVRELLDINSLDFVEFCIEGKQIIIEKYHPRCEVCGSKSNLIAFKKERFVCGSCHEHIRSKEAEA